jgi:prepilin-type N-terminal cleavage/methylation domain-containing protein
MKATKAFTLIELLVVVSTISLLVALRAESRSEGIVDVELVSRPRDNGSLDQSRRRPTGGLASLDAAVRGLLTSSGDADQPA